MISRLKFLLVPTAVLVLGAGMVIGRISTHLPAATQPSDKPAPWFDEQLNLTADQRKQMDAIWGDVQQSMGKTFDGRFTMERDRDQAVRELLTDEQKKAYDNIYAQYRVKRTELDTQRDKLFADANQRSRAILDDSQKKRWDALSQQHHGWPGGGGRPRGGPRGGPGSQPTSRPFGQGWPGGGGDNGGGRDGFHPNDRHQ